MKGIQTLTLSEDSINEALTDYLNKHLVHKGPIQVGEVTFASGNRLEVEFEEQPAAKSAQDTNIHIETTGNMVVPRSPSQNTAPDRLQPQAPIAAQDKAPSQTRPR